MLLWDDFHNKRRNPPNPRVYILKDLKCHRSQLFNTHNLFRVEKEAQWQVTRNNIMIGEKIITSATFILGVEKEVSRTTLHTVIHTLVSILYLVHIQ